MLLPLAQATPLEAVKSVISVLTAGGTSARKRSGLTASVTSMPTMPEEDEDIQKMSMEELVVK